MKWILTDPDTNQAYRRCTEFIHELKQKGIPQRLIDLRRFSTDLIEDTIKSYGYTLRPEHNNVFKMYGEDAEQIIAECLFESQIKEDL